MCCDRPDCLLTHSDKSIVFLVDIKVLNDAFSEEVLEVFEAQRQILNVLLCEHGASTLAHDQGPHESATICRNEDTIDLPIVVD